MSNILKKKTNEVSKPMLLAWSLSWNPVVLLFLEEGHDYKIDLSQYIRRPELDQKKE